MRKDNKEYVITDADIWINRNENCPDGVIGVDWVCPQVGFGRWEMILDKDGVPHIYTEHMDIQNDKAFSETILKKILEVAVIEE